MESETRIIPIFGNIRMWTKRFVKIYYERLMYALDHFPKRSAVRQLACRHREGILSLVHLLAGSHSA